ncbi:MAG: NADH-quinone oxidoreductase subunit C [Spirochaetia bacterium]|jgi:NADH-quinone oxidoreductase subunit C|nr:NADH-quinone oxidoreductase subunit C [Spirochaetia bacterium]
MTSEEVRGGLRERFGEDILEFFEKSDKRLYMEVRIESLVTIASYIFKDLEARFHTASGVDTRTGIEVLYHFSIEDSGYLISVRVKLDRENPQVDSLSSVIIGAEWIEREMYELLGINFRGHPDLRRLLLSDLWPGGVYPLKADYKEWDKNAVRDRGV